MYVIRDATNAFAKLDKTPPDEVAPLDKSLRNLSQRVYLPAAGREGRADAYALETICTLRMLHKASVFGLDRWQLEKLAQFLQVADPMGNGRREKLAGRSRLLSPIEEAMQRVRAGEAFSVVIAMLSDGTFKVRTDWEPDEEPDEAAEEILAALGGTLSEDARFVLPASRLLSELLAELGA
ncbi:hypothetical protein [Sagittula sp. MA-2]|jgi:hypothetical protein|uniref:hypothetical protein n=1 Tax=Sagittula sp. MA-2 TaxID=3048007 RepID=UPI0024C39EA2|nr:hypothetical protein [Sagittula sp. MA-2]WHZ35475.1 hypothetical protein QNI11_00370 [Sagittula sp. MA-2]